MEEMKLDLLWVKKEKNGRIESSHGEIGAEWIIRCDVHAKWFWEVLVFAVFFEPEQWQFKGSFQITSVLKIEERASYGPVFEAGPIQNDEIEDFVINEIEKIYESGGLANS